MYSRKIINLQRSKLERALGFGLREYSPAEIEDFSYRMRKVEWEPGQTEATIRSLPEDCQEYIFNEYHLCKLDFEYWCSRYAKVISDKGTAVAIKPWPSQRELLHRLAMSEEKQWIETGVPEVKIPIILLKSRQVGGTVMSEALIAHLTLFSTNTRSIIASDHPDNSLKLFRVFTTILDKLPGWMKPVLDARVKANNIHFSELESDVIVGSGNQKTTLGQGMTVDAAHLTEVSTWNEENCHAIDADLRPAFASSRKHHSLLIFESTGAGAKGNWFHDQFQAAREGRSQFDHLFVGWFMCPDKWARKADGITFSEETMNMAIRVERESGVVLSKEQMAWWQTEKQDYESRGKLEVFYQEYPSTPQEAFQTGLRSVFTLDTRMRIRDACKAPQAVYEVDLATTSDKRLRNVSVGDWLRSDDPSKAEGKLIIWEQPQRGFLYVVGVDASYGIDGGDPACVQVLRVGNKWLPDEQVAEYWGMISPMDLCTPVELVGKIYTDKIDGMPAKLAIEVNPGAPGGTTQAELLKRGYPNFYRWRSPRVAGGPMDMRVGWETNMSTRNQLVDRGVDAVKKRELIINSPFFVDEMDSFTTTYTQAGSRKVEHAPGYHDDRIFALFIAFYVSHEGDMSFIADERRRMWEMMDAPPEKVQQLQNVMATCAPGQDWDYFMAEWENNLPSFQ